MAGIAGAMAGYVGAGLRSRSNEAIVENGGDIFIFSRKERRLGVYAGDSPLSGKVALKVGPCDEPLGICTSSGTVGHSKSFGRADAALVISPDIILADCAATAVGNCVNSEDDLDAAIGFAKSVPGITGALIIIGARMAVWGDVRLV